MKHRIERIDQRLENPNWPEGWDVFVDGKNVGRFANGHYVTYKFKGRKKKYPTVPDKIKGTWAEVQATLKRALERDV